MGFKCTRRARDFLEVPEAVDILSLFTQIFGNPEQGEYVSRGLNQFHNWLDTLEARGKELVKTDAQLAHYITDLKTEIKQSVTDYALLERVLTKQGWDPSTPYDRAIHKRALVSAPGLSAHAKNAMGARYFEKFLDRQHDAGTMPLSLSYILNRATSVDWSVLDLFYRFCGFNLFKAMFNRAEKLGDEGPLANLALISNYLAQFNDIHGTVITGRRLSDKRFQEFLTTLLRHTTYQIHIDDAALIAECVERLNAADVPQPVIVVEQGSFNQTTYTIRLDRVIKNSANIVVERVSTTGEEYKKPLPGIDKGKSLARLMNDERLRDYKVSSVDELSESVTFGADTVLYRQQPLIHTAREGISHIRTAEEERSTYPVFNLLDRAA